MPIQSFLRSAGGADLGKEVGAEDADGVDDHDERDDQLDRRRDELTSLEGDTANDHDGVRDILGAERREEGRNDAVGEGSEEPTDRTTEVECSRKQNQIAGIKHLFVLDSREKTDCDGGTRDGLI